MLVAFNISLRNFRVWNCAKKIWMPPTFTFRELFSPSVLVNINWRIILTKCKYILTGHFYIVGVIGKRSRLVLLGQTRDFSFRQDARRYTIFEPSVAYPGSNLFRTHDSGKHRVRIQVFSETGSGTKRTGSATLTLMRVYLVGEATGAVLEEVLGVRERDHQEGHHQKYTPLQQQKFII